MSFPEKMSTAPQHPDFVPGGRPVTPAEKFSRNLRAFSAVPKTINPNEAPVDPAAIGERRNFKNAVGIA